MKFGSELLSAAAGGILAHSLQVGSKRFKKGRILSAVDCEYMREQGIERTVLARLEPDDIGEDQAAAAIAAAIAGAAWSEGLSVGAAFTGRANVYASQRGLLQVDTTSIDQFNLSGEAITLATLGPDNIVETRQMLATIKIIPFGVKRAHLQRCLDIVQSSALLRLRPFIRQRIGVVQTLAPGIKDSVLDKTKRVLQQRLAILGAELSAELRCSHEQSALAAALGQLLAAHCELILVVGASAIVDRRDVIPAAIQQAGGRIEHYGMPVDPGNLLLLGYRGEVPVLGLPGCARSPKPNGVDPVLARLCAGLEVCATDIMRMGVGGLLKELPSRPQPRSSDQLAEQDRVPARAPRIAGLLLAAGQSRRMGDTNKLLLDIKGQTLIRRVAAALDAAAVCGIWVVTGHEAERVEQALQGMTVHFVPNQAYAAGLSTSLQAGLRALPADIDGVLICLGDMPDISQPLIDKLIAAFDPVEGRAICVPTYQGKRGNPVLWSRRFIPEMLELAGDAGAKHLLGEHSDLVCELETEDRAILLDLDSPAEVAAYQA